MVVTKIEGKKEMLREELRDDADKIICTDPAMGLV